MSMARNGETKLKQPTACDLQHRIRVSDPGPDGCEFLCCDSRQCLFKVESAGRLFCILKKPGDGDE